LNEGDIKSVLKSMDRIRKVVDGKRTAQQIMEKLKMNEDEFIRAFELLHDTGAIMLKEDKKDTKTGKMLREIFGDFGVRVYRLIDGKTTVEQILTEALPVYDDVSCYILSPEDRMIEELELLEGLGLIRIEMPRFVPPHNIKPANIDEIEKNGMRSLLNYVRNIKKNRFDELYKDYLLPYPSGAIPHRVK